MLQMNVVLSYFYKIDPSECIPNIRLWPVYQLQLIDLIFFSY